MTNPANRSETWKALQDFARALLDERPDALPMDLTNPNAASESDKRALLSAIHQDRNLLRHPAAHESLIESWYGQALTNGWFESLRQALQSMGASQTEESMPAAAGAIQTVIDRLTQRLQPAPAMRGPATQRMELEKKPRRLHAADLPAFNPFFCTSIPKVDTPTVLQGLKANCRYRFTTLTAASENEAQQFALESGTDGTLTVDFASAVYGDSAPGSHVKTAWFLEEEEAPAQDATAWISGLLWPQPEEHPGYPVAELYPQLAANNADPLVQERLDTLMAIAKLVGQQRYIEAYETSRQTLLFSPNRHHEDEIVPFHEALWEFLVVILQQMQIELKAAEEIFIQHKSQWNASRILEQVIQEISA